MQIVKLKLSELAPNTGQIPGLPRNPRTWTQGDINRLAQSLQETPELFEARPIIAVPFGKKYVILGGNLRYEGAKKNGDRDVPVCILPEDTPVDKMKEIVIKDNGSFGSWDTDELASWPVETFELVDWGVPDWITGGAGSAQQQGSGASGSAGAGSATEDDFDENKDGILVRCKPGDVWALGEHRLMCGDSIDLQQVTTLMGGVR